MLLPGTCCDWQTNFCNVFSRLKAKYHLICVNYRSHIEETVDVLDFTKKADAVYFSKRVSE